MKDKKNILYITYDGLTDPLGTSQILPYIVGLSQKGYNFTVISAEKTLAFAERKKEIEKICKKNNIDWFPTEYTKKPPIFSTIKDIGKINRLAIKLHKKKGFSIVHCRSYIPAIVGLSLKQNYGLKFIFDMRGFYADERVDGNIWNLKKIHYRLIYNYFKKKEKEFLKNADAIVSLTHAGKKILISDWEVKRQVFVIPCAVDTKLFNPENYQSSTANRQLTLGYLGSIGTWYMLDEMLDFFKTILEKYPEAKFKFITKEPAKTILKKAMEKSIPEKHFEISSASRQEVPKQLSNIDIGIFFIKPVFSKKASSPTKQGEFMAMGIPIITNSGVGDTDNIIQKYKSGILVKDFSNIEYKDTVNQIDGFLKKSISRNIRYGAEDYFSLNKGVNVYFELYKEL